MNKSLSILVMLLSSFQCLLSQNPLPAVFEGKLERLSDFPSKYITSRNIDIWLPEGYTTAKRYAVLYMHDGQMLYDPELSWNKQAWNVDDVASGLFRKGNVREFIVVGIWNGGVTRHPDYFPRKPFESLSQIDKDTVTAQLQRAGRTEAAFSPNSDNYLKFIVKELKPFIDSRYSVYSDRKNTFIAGSSMGGLISLYATCEYPDVFGSAACLSTHWIGTFTPDHNPLPAAFLDYLRNHLPDPANHRIYFDCGDQTLDAYYPDIQKQVDRLMQEKGYSEKNWRTEYFPGEDHSEKAWNKRLHIPLEFLFK